MGGRTSRATERPPLATIPWDMINGGLGPCGSSEDGKQVRCGIYLGGTAEWFSRLNVGCEKTRSKDSSTANWLVIYAATRMDLPSSEMKRTVGEAVLGVKSGMQWVLDIQSEMVKRLLCMSLEFRGKSWLQISIYESPLGKVSKAMRLRSPRDWAQPEKRSRTEPTDAYI